MTFFPARGERAKNNPFLPLRGSISLTRNNFLKNLWDKGIEDREFA